MVKGIKIFREYFGAFEENYIIIGGAACDIIIDDAGLEPRATKDIDIIIVVEALSADFVRQFWKFIEVGKYERKEKDEKDRKYYRFTNPEHEHFPAQLELFSRNPDLMDLDEGSYLTPIPVDDYLLSLSAILLNEEYYKFLLEHCISLNELKLANNEALICLKAKAFNDMANRKVKGEKTDEKKIRKHKNDVYRMATLITVGDVFDLPESIKNDMQEFVNRISDELPDNNIFKTMGVNTVSAKEVHEQIKTSFKLT
jgi:hypothetical protein